MNTPASETTLNNIILFNGENRTIKLRLDEITHIESEKHYLIFYSNNNQTLKIRCNMQDAENQLWNYGFIRVQRGFIVNMRYITSLSARNITLHDGTKINISRSKPRIPRDNIDVFPKSI